MLNLLYRGNFMQNRLSKGLLLDNNGDLVQAGYSTNLIKEYNNEA